MPIVKIALTYACRRSESLGPITPNLSSLKKHEAITIRDVHVKHFPRIRLNDRSHYNF